MSSENTPLLADPESADYDSNQAGTQDSPQTQGDGVSPTAENALTPRSHKGLLGLLYAQLALSVLFCFLALAAILLKFYGRTQYGIYDWFLEAQVIIWIFVTGAFCIFHAVFNIIRLRRNGFAKLPSLRLLVIAAGIMSLMIAFVVGPEYLDNWFCSKTDLDGGHWPGTWEQCRRWELGYLIVIWATVVTLGLNALACFAFVITAFVVARDRREEQAPPWAIPPGYVSIDVNFHWGGANPHQQQQGQLQQSAATNGSEPGTVQSTAGQS